MPFSKNNATMPAYKNGSVVRVRPTEEIKKTLDAMNIRNGCLFMDEMWDYCGKECTILKVVNNFFDENRFIMHKVKAPTYLLENGICGGNVESFPQQCDRSCYFLWLEDWLVQEK